MTTWAETQKQQTESFSRRLEDSWAATNEFWRHLVIVEATVLGLTVGLMGGRDQVPAITLILSWVCLLFAIALGCVLVKVAIDVTIDGAVRGYRGAADIAGIMARVEAGELDPKSDDYQGLFVAATFLNAPNEAARAAFNPEAKKLAAAYADKLPTSSFLNMPRRSPPERWLHAHWQGLAQAFYALSFAAFVLLLATAGPWAFRARFESPPPAATSPTPQLPLSGPPPGLTLPADSAANPDTSSAQTRPDSSRVRKTPAGGTSSTQSSRHRGAPGSTAPPADSLP